MFCELVGWEIAWKLDGECHHFPFMVVLILAEDITVGVLMLDFVQLLRWTEDWDLNDHRSAYHPPSECGMICNEFSTDRR